MTIIMETIKLLNDENLKILKFRISQNWRTLSAVFFENGLKTVWSIRADTISLVVTALRLSVVEN